MIASELALFLAASAPAYPLDGSVLDAEHALAVGALVRAQLNLPEGPGEVAATATTGADGAFHLEVELGVYDVVATRREATASRRVVVSGPATVELAFLQPGAIRGRLIDESGSAARHVQVSANVVPFDGARLAARGIRTGTYGWTETNARGTFAILGLRTGVRFSVEARRGSDRARVTASAGEEVAIALHRDSDVPGTTARAVGSGKSDRSRSGKSGRPLKGARHASHRK